MSFTQPSKKALFRPYGHFCEFSSVIISWKRLNTISLKFKEVEASLSIERFRAGHFTCKNTDWEKWREPIRKVEPETTDWALHTRIPARIKPSHFLTAAECWLVLIDRRIGQMILKAGFHFSVSFVSPFFFASAFLFFLLFCCFTKMTRVFPQLRTCFQFIYLFIYLCIFIHLPPRRRRGPCRRCHTHRLRLKRLFASVATVCFEVDTSAVKHHSFFLGYYTAILSLKPQKWSKLSKLTRRWRHQLEIDHVAIFRFHGVRHTWT